MALEEEEEEGQGDDTQLEEEQLELKSVSSEFSLNASRPDYVVFAFDKEYTTREQLDRFDPEALCAFLVMNPKDYALEKVSITLSFDILS